MDVNEKIERGEKLKKKGNALFKAKRFSEAAKKYESVCLRVAAHVCFPVCSQAASKAGLVQHNLDRNGRDLTSDEPSVFDSVPGSHRPRLTKIRFIRNRVAVS